jgi:phage terminase small subunit
MSRELTKKQFGFVQTYAETGNATLAVKENYDLSDKNDDNTAAVMGNELLSLPKVKKALHAMGFNSDNAKRVVAEILNDETNEPKDRLKAAELTFKVGGDFAAEKHLNLNLTISDVLDSLDNGQETTQ